MLEKQILKKINVNIYINYDSKTDNLLVTRKFGI